jgi:hypothetical protein
MTATTETESLGNCVSCDVILPEIEHRLKMALIQRDALTAKVSRLLAEFAQIERETDKLEEVDVQAFDMAVVGKVVPLIEYRKLQLKSAKSRVSLKVQVEKLREKIRNA